MLGLLCDILRDSILSWNLLSFLQCFVLFFDLGVLNFADVNLVFLLGELAFVVSNLHVFVESVALAVRFLVDSGKPGFFFLSFDTFCIFKRLLYALCLRHGFLLAVISKCLLLLQPVAFLFNLSLPVREKKISIDALILRSRANNLQSPWLADEELVTTTVSWAWSRASETYLLSLDLVLDLVSRGFSFVFFGTSLGQLKFLLGFDLSFAGHFNHSTGLSCKFLFNHCLFIKQFFVFSLLHL